MSSLIASGFLLTGLIATALVPRTPPALELVQESGDEPALTATPAN